MSDAYAEPEGVVIAILILVILCFSIGVGFKVSQKFDEIEKPQKLKYEKYIKENCELAGWYGKTGNQEFYKCHGKLMKDSEIKEIIK